MRKLPRTGVIKTLVASLLLILTASYLVYAYLSIFTCNLAILNIKRQFASVSNILNLIIKPPINQDTCWMHVTVSLKDKGEVVWPIFTEGNNQFEASFPNEKLKVLSLNALREQRRSNRDDTFLSGRYNIVTDFKVIPFEIDSPSELLVRYDEIVQLGLTENAKGISEDVVSTDVDHDYFVVYKFRDSD